MPNRKIKKKNSKNRSGSRGVEGPIVGVAIGGFEIAIPVEFGGVPEPALEVGNDHDLRPQLLDPSDEDQNRSGSRGVEGPIVGVAIGGFEIAIPVEFGGVPELVPEVGDEQELRPQLLDLSDKDRVLVD
ncbi:hypothetical protein U1Q18_005227 [Sarracenia purpurea var. burkii]